MKPRIKPGRWVKLIWRDSADEKQTWMREDEIDENPVEVTSYGWLIRRSKVYYTIAGDVHKAGEEKVYGRVTRIATGMIVSIHEVK